MTNAPHLLPKSRAGSSTAPIDLLDAMAYDGLTDPFDHIAMGESTERYNAHLGISREEQDAFAARSHQRAAVARKDGLFDDEIVAVPVPQRRGEPVMVSQDEGIREDTTVESLARLRPAFATDGTITAGSASQISDGACAVARHVRANAGRRGCRRSSRRSVRTAWWPGQTTRCSRSPRTRSRAPWHATTGAREIDLFEINEAFAAVAIQSMRELDVDPTRQRQRRSDRTRSPDRHVRCAARTAPG